MDALQTQYSNSIFMFLSGTRRTEVPSVNTLNADMWSIFWAGCDENPTKSDEFLKYFHKEMILYFGWPCNRQPEGEHERTQIHNQSIIFCLLVYFSVTFIVYAKWITMCKQNCLFARSSWHRLNDNFSMNLHLRCLTFSIRWQML